MKKTLYILMFALLGVLMQFLVHAGTEIIYIRILVSNFDRYGFGLTWDQWILIHNIGTAVLFVAGVVLGIWQGFFWWPRIYGPWGYKSQKEVVSEVDENDNVLGRVTKKISNKGNYNHTSKNYLFVIIHSFDILYIYSPKSI